MLCVLVLTVVVAPGRLKLQQCLYYKEQLYSSKTLILARDLHWGHRKSHYGQHCEHHISTVTIPGR